MLSFGFSYQSLDDPGLVRLVFFPLIVVVIISIGYDDIVFCRNMATLLQLSPMGQKENLKTQVVNSPTDDRQPQGGDTKH